MFTRADRVGEEIKRVLAHSIQYDLNDPKKPEFSSVLKVELSKDLAYAKVFVSVLGEEKERKRMTAVLGRAKGFLRKELAQKLMLRQVPELRFILDDSMEKAAKMNALIDQVLAADRAKEEDSASSD